MKLLKYGFFLILAAMLAYSCKKDLGNYNYTGLPSFYVDTVKQVTTFTAKSGIPNGLVINPKVVYAGDTTNLTYLWRAYSTGAADTISKKKNLSALVSYIPGTYTAELQVTDKTNGIKALMRYTFTILASIPDGWLVAYETVAGGSTDVSLIRHAEININVTKDSIYRDIFSAVNGVPLTGTPIGVVSNVSSPTLDMLVTNKTAAVMNRSTYKTLLDYQHMFSGAPVAANNIQAINEIPFFGNHMVINGAVVWMYSGLFVGPITVDTKGYYAAPFIATYYAQNGFFYDALNMRFCYLQQQTSQGAACPGPATGFTPRFRLDNIGKNMVYMGLGNGTTAAYDTYKIAIFEDPDKSHRWLYGITPATPNAPDYAMIDISNMPNIFIAKYFALGTIANVVYYATDNAVYSFNYTPLANSAAVPTAAGFTAPVGEVITTMKLFTSAGIGYTAANSQSNKFLYVATWNATTKTGKVYVLAVNSTSGGITATPLKTLSGSGKIGSMTYKPA